MDHSAKALRHPKSYLDVADSFAKSIDTVIPSRFPMRQRLEYAAAWPFITTLRILPRPMARAVAIGLSYIVYVLHARLRRVGMRNLELAFPEKNKAERARILRSEFASLGRQLAEVCHFPEYTLENIDRVVVFEGFEHFEHAKARGKGVLLFAGHFGGWELSSFVISMRGHWMHVIMRGMDNVYLGQLIEHYRTMHGNKAVDKDDFVRGLLSAMRAGEVVGMLIDTNMTPPQGIFVDFFGIPACTASGLARIALKTDAAVVPTFTIWDAALGKYRLRFDPAIDLVRTSDLEADIKANTQKFTTVIEDYVRKYPEQWLWVHRRWKTRPAGEKPVY
jgi:Kdo2-lipid IVA lauroyltransferase/acyltransferase